MSDGDASEISTTFILQGFCSDEWAESGMDYVLAEISTSRANHLLDLMERVGDLKELDSSAFRLEVWDWTPTGHSYYGTMDRAGLLDAREEDEIDPSEAVFSRLVADVVERNGELCEIPAGLPRPEELRPGRVDASLVRIGEKDLLWEITPKHTNLEVQTAVVSRGYIERLPSKHACLEATGDAQRERFQALGREDPELAMQLLREEVWLFEAGGQEARRIEALTSEDVVPLLGSRDEDIRERAFRALGDLPDGEPERRRGR